MKRLIEKGVIKKFTVVIDESISERVVQVLFGFKAPNAEHLLKELAGVKGVSEAYVTSGEKNVFCKATISNMETFKKLLEKFADLGLSFEANIILKTAKLSGYAPRLRLKPKCDYCGKRSIGRPQPRA